MFLNLVGEISGKTARASLNRSRGLRPCSARTASQVPRTSRLRLCRGIQKLLGLCLHAGEAQKVPEPDAQQVDVARRLLRSGRCRAPRAAGKSRSATSFRDTS